MPTPNLVAELATSINADPGMMIPLATAPEEGIIFGTLPLMYGGLTAVVRTQNPNPVRHEVYAPARTKEISYARVMGEAVGDFKKFKGADLDLAHTLGYGVETVERENGEVVDVAILPTASYLNIAMSTIYEVGPDGSKVEPPFTFVDKRGLEGEIKGADSIPALGRREILVTAPNNIGYYKHDFIDHVLGYARIDAITMGHLQSRARQLESKGKLKTFANGTLVDRDASRLVVLVDSLSDALADYETQGRPAVLTAVAANYLRDSFRGVLKSEEIETMVTSLIDHQSWLDGRTKKLASAA